MRKKPEWGSLFIPGIGRGGMTALHWAANRGDPEAALAALASGCLVDERDQVYGFTPLHWLADMAATGGDRLAVLDVLVRHGADLDARCDTNESAIELAREAGSDTGDRLVEALIRFRAKA